MIDRKGVIYKGRDGLKSNGNFLLQLTQKIEH